jgi:hypothetical protein
VRSKPSTTKETATKKGRKYKTKPTTKQKLAFKKTIENRGNVSKSMREAGYSEETAKNPKNLTESKGWLELVDVHLADDLLAQVHAEGLAAGRKVFKNNVTTGEIEDLGFEPDFAVRHKYLDTAYKIKKKYSEDTLNKTLEDEIEEDIKLRRAMREKKYGKGNA